MVITSLLNKDLKVSSPEESDLIMAHENAHFSNGNYEQGAQGLRMKMRNAELYLELQLFTACNRLQQDCPK